MTARQATIDSGIGLSCIASTVVHLAVFLLLVWWGKLFPVNMKLQETYYVDVVNLPVSAPQAGNPQQKGSDQEAPPPPQKLPESTMTVPPAPKPGAKKPPDKMAKSAEKKVDPNEYALAESISKIVEISEAKRQAAAIERARKKVETSGSGRSGMPGANGTEAGSDYLSHILLLLSEVFREPPHTDSNVFAMIKIKITGKGKVGLVKVLKSSGNTAFDSFAVRSVYEAEKKFPPPPTGSFEFNFKFRPQGISAK